MPSRLEACLAATAAERPLYRPEFLRLGRATDRERWSRLLEDPGTRVFDALTSQLSELVRSLEPARRFTAERLQAAVQAHVGPTPIQEYGVWVWYPWSGRLVHLLDREEFAVVRTDRNRNKITREEQELLSRAKVGVVGLSVGQSVALTLALERGFGELRIADLDTLDLSNLNRIRSGVHLLGLSKCVNVAREIAEIDPFLEVRCFEEGLNADNMDRFFTDGGRLDVLVEECDAVDIKILARLKARELRIPVVMDTSDRGMLDIERFDLEPDRSLLHGLIDHLDPADAAKARTNEEKLPFLAPMAGLETLSTRMKASLLELGETVGTWPQLASNVVLGGALAADAVRRIVLGQMNASGRWYVDLEELIGGTKREIPMLYAGIRPEKVPALSLDRMLAAAGRYGNAAMGSFTRAQAEAIATAGALAPSAGNMQPWKFLFLDGRILLFHDRERSASKLDPDELIPTIALGACVENMVLRAQELGLRTRVETPFGADDGPFAVLSCTGTHVAAPDPLAAYIGQRHSNRRKADGRTIEAEAFVRMEQATAECGGGRLHVLTDPEDIGRIATIAGIAERLRIMNPYGHLEFFAHEVRWNDEEAQRTKDGLDIATLEVDMVGRTGLRAASDPEAIAFLRSTKGGKGFEKISGEAVRHSPAVALVSIEAHTPEDRFNGSRAAERAWLAATREGLAVHPISAAIFLGHAARLLGEDVLTADERADFLELRSRLIQTTGLEGREPLFMVRLSHAGAASARSLRLPLERIFFAPTPTPITH